MLIVSQPISWNHFDSARVEKRGPWMTTTVPPSRAGMPSSPAVSTRSARRSGAVRVGGRDVRRLGPVVEGVRPPARPVDELVADDELAELELGLERARGVRPDDPPDAELLHRPDIRAVGNRVRRELVVQPVAREKSDALPADLADRERRRRLPVRRLDRHLLDVRRGTSRSPTRRRPRSQPSPSSPSPVSATACAYASWRLATDCVEVADELCRDDFFEHRRQRGHRVDRELRLLEVAVVLRFRVSPSRR